MSHEITIREDGFAEAVFAMEPAWHGLGKVFDHPMTSLECLKEGGLDWLIVQRPVAVGEEVPVSPDEVKTIWHYQEGFKANVRQDTNALMGLVTNNYKVVQNQEAFAFLDKLVENHEMLYESAFSLYGGRKVCMLARMPGVQEVVKGDHILPYILLSLSHDGSEAIRFGPTAVRVVCANTYALAVGSGTVKELSVRHMGNIESKLSQARNILGVASNQFAQYAEIGKQLAQRKLTAQEWRDYLNLMCPELDPRDPDYSELRAERLADTRLAIASCYHNERNTLEGMENTCWAAYNAVVEHIDHLPRRGATRQQKAEARFNVTMFGPGRDMKKRALAMACKFANLEVAL
jgi:phage/plasmid-like protein (TIGR03299 family)